MQTGGADPGFWGCSIPLYFAVWLMLAGVSLLFSLSAEPAKKKIWNPWIGLFNLLVIGGFLVVFSIKGGGGYFTIFLLVFLVVIGYLGIFRTRVCERCGKTAQPDFTGKAARYCSRCGAELSPTELRWPGSDSTDE